MSGQINSRIFLDFYRHIALCVPDNILTFERNWLGSLGAMEAQAPILDEVFFSITNY